MPVYVMAVENDSCLGCSRDVASDVQVDRVAIERDVIVAKVVLPRLKHALGSEYLRCSGRDYRQRTCKNTRTCGFDAPAAALPDNGGLGGFFGRCGGQTGGGGAGASPAYGQSGHDAELRLVAALRRQVGGEDVELDCSTHAVQLSCATQAAQQSSGELLSGSIIKASPR